MAQMGLVRAEGALCFATTAYGAAYPMILRTVASETKTREVAGCSGAGVIAAPNEVETGHGLAVIVFGGDLAARRFFVPSIRGRGHEVAVEIAAAVRPGLGASNLMCVFPDTYNTPADDFIAGLTQKLDGVAIVGGGATEDGTIGETFQFCGDTVSSNSVSGLLLSGDFDVRITNASACSLIGPPHRVTGCRDNVILQLDGRPAFEVFAQAAGPLAADLRRALGFVFVAIPVPRTADKLDRGQFIVRNIVGASQEHGVIAVAHTPRVGEVIGLVLRNADRAREELKASLADAAAVGGAPPAFGLYFDCVSRGAGLYGMPGHDTAYIRNYLGEFPLGGFFTGFEIGAIAGRPEILQYCGVLATVSPR
jgi:small ligand-binding sensory domain FIST